MKIYKTKLKINGVEHIIICQANSEYYAADKAIEAKIQDTGAGLFGSIQKFGPIPKIQIVSVNSYKQ